MSHFNYVTLLNIIIKKTINKVDDLKNRKKQTNKYISGHK